MNNKEVNKLDSIPVEIPEKSLLRRMGAARGHKMSPRMKNRIKKAVQEVNRDIEAKAIYRVLPVVKQNGSIQLEGGVSFKSRKLGHLFGPCDRAVVFLTTIGPEVEKTINNNMENQPHYGVILDAAASAAAESTAQYIQDHIENKLHKEGKITLRYSPGYCDWPISEQKEIFKILPHETIGVHLSENSFMSPRKSISGVIGICPLDSPEFSRSACESCQKQNCPHRRSEFKPRSEVK